MSVLARMSGVPAATIKHYVREGLLPSPGVKTSRNMAYYDPALVDRIHRIKTLQREHFLPLRLIKSVLDGDPTADGDAEAAAAIQRALVSMAPAESRTREQLLASGLPAGDLAFFESLGLLTPDGDSYGGDDLTLLRLLGEARRAGITRAMLPPDIIGPYVLAIRELVKVELELFRRGVAPRAGGDLARITDVATRLSEQLVVLIRRKMLVPTLQAMVAEHEAAPAKRGKRAKPPARPPRRGRSAR